MLKMSSQEEVDADTNTKSKAVSQLRTIPCLKKSLTYGITGGLGVGLAHFLFTSNVSKAVNYALGGYLVVLFGTWGVCRYHAAVERFNFRQWQKANMQQTQNFELLDPKDV